MSAVWPTAWQLLSIGPQNASLKRAMVLTASQLFKKIPRVTLRRSIQIRYISGAPNKPANLISDIYISHHWIDLGNLCKTPRTTKRHSTKSQTWKPSSSGGGAKPPNHASNLAAMNISDVDIRAIFGGSLDRQGGNKLLQILQNQRISGTLDQDVDASPIDIVKALAWLRIKIPVDEDQAIIARLEREEIEDERNLQLELERLSRYQPQQDSLKDGIYGRSHLEEIMETNKRKAAEKEEEEKKREADKPKRSYSPSKAVIERRAKKAKWVQHYKDQAQRKGKFVTDMTRFERLGPSTAVAVSVVLISILFAHFYTPPSQKARIWPETPPAAATVITLIGLNVLIFFVWKIPPAWKFMNRHFMMTAAHPFSSSMFGSIFSHHEFGHLARNMIVLWFVGTRCWFSVRGVSSGCNLLIDYIVHDDIGRGEFLAVYFSTGVMASLASLSSHVLRKLLHTYSLGASGAVCGLVACWAWIHAEYVLSCF